MDSILEALRALQAAFGPIVLSANKGHEREDVRAKIIEAMSDEQIEFCFYMAVILDLDVSANRLQREMAGRKEGASQ